MSPCFPTVKGLTADCGLSDSLWFPSISIRYSYVYIRVCVCVCVTGRKKDIEIAKELPDQDTFQLCHVTQMCCGLLPQSQMAG